METPAEGLEGRPQDAEVLVGQRFRAARRTSARPATGRKPVARRGSAAPQSSVPQKAEHPDRASDAHAKRYDPAVGSPSRGVEVILAVGPLPYDAPGGQ